MAKKPAAENSQLPFMFGDNFLLDHAGHIIEDPKVAIIELIANAYDAGAKNICISWPAQENEIFRITDDGTGMSLNEFERRWKTLNYDRTKEQGTEVVFPEGVKSTARTAFGKNGKGRHAAFCFGDEYFVETRKGGVEIRVRVQRSSVANEPFVCQRLETKANRGHGTLVEVVVHKNLLPEESLREIIGSKFLVDPSFEIKVNNRMVELLDLRHIETYTLDVKPYGKIEVHHFDSELHNKTIKFKGIAWWVNHRLVGLPSWEGLEGEGNYLDGRASLAKRYSFIVSADILQDTVKADWTGFHANAKANKTREAVHGYVVKTLNGLMASTRKERKIEAIQQHRKLIGELSVISRQAVGDFIDKVQEKCPSMSGKDLQKVVEVMSVIEQSRSGFEILHQLEKCSPDDIDTWNELMKKWTATEAEVVLNELDRRLSLIKKLETLVDSKSTDELHDLQPLFERGLWMYGPEFEAIEFRSNRRLVSVIEQLLGGTKAILKNTRPDFVCLPDRSIGIYSTYCYEPNGGEVSGIDRILIIELKKGGFTLTQTELDQARNYGKELKKGDGVKPTTRIDAYVMGSKFENGLELNNTTGNITITPLTYGTLLQRAHARTFNLQTRINESIEKLPRDTDIEKVLAMPEQVGLPTEDEGIGGFKSAIF